MVTWPLFAVVAEHDLVDRLLQDSYWRAAILNISGIPNKPVVRTRVALSGLPGQGDGDVDVLVGLRTEPHRATAVEVKRIKVSSRAIATGQPNKLQEYEKACRQANRLGRAGFWQAYLFIIVVVDSRVLNPGSTGYTGASAAIERLIDETIGLHSLDPRVGLVRHDIVQSMNREPLNAGSGGSSLVRLATQAAQPSEVTQWVTQNLRLCNREHR